MDMTKDIFAEQSYGKAALKKLVPTSPNFRLFQAGWLGKTPKDWTIMKVSGAEFRHAKSGPRAGQLSIRVPGTTQSCHVSRTEMQAFKAAPSN